MASHSKVLEVGVKGVPYDKSTETPMAFIVKKDDGLTEEEIRHYCNEAMASYKVPKYYVFRNELLKTNIGRILRKDLTWQENKSILPSGAKLI